MLAPTPPLGWNSWNTFGIQVNERLIYESAEMLVYSGLKDLGYVYLVIDDGWSLRHRDADRRLVPDPGKIPERHSRGCGLFARHGFETRHLLLCLAA